MKLRCVVSATLLLRVVVLAAAAAAAAGAGLRRRSTEVASPRLGRLNPLHFFRGYASNIKNGIPGVGFNVNSDPGGAEQALSTVPLVNPVDPAGTIQSEENIAFLNLLQGTFERLLQTYENTLPTVLQAATGSLSVERFASAFLRPSGGSGSDDRLQFLSLFPGRQTGDRRRPSRSQFFQTTSRNLWTHMFPHVLPFL